MSADTTHPFGLIAPRREEAVEFRLRVAKAGQGVTPS
jgi:hypothetical protein